jgi:3-dehydroquinate synthase
VFIEAGAITRLDDYVAQHLPGRRVALVSDATVAQLYQAGRFGQGQWTGETLTFPAGETSKTRETWARLTDRLLERRFGRDSGIIAMGGGVTGDLAGFVAATYMRGIPYLQVPTTLLAMLDASVGGKTGVDTPRGKNLVGSFHAPAAVLADPLALGTVPDRDYRAGLAEAVKHGLISDAAYFRSIESTVPELLRRDPETLTRLIRRSVEIKAEIVSEDEHEGGRRAILNAGHTVAHALEQASGYAMPHGEAVSVGLVLECQMAEELGLAEPGTKRRVAHLVGCFGLPGRIPSGVEKTALLFSMMGDKKNRAGQIRCALPAGVGRMHPGERWTTAVPERVLRQVIASG